ncbi:hypothetical protein [Actinomadura sp. 6N118]|uniref:hypothetical protein n=1 Tax=Actinomadura sp. 6N118 TaxID=3375151 RepID=UPI0037AAE18F
MFNQSGGRRGRVGFVAAPAVHLGGDAIPLVVEIGGILVAVDELHWRATEHRASVVS